MTGIHLPIPVTYIWGISRVTFTSFWCWLLSVDYSICLVLYVWNLFLCLSLSLRSHHHGMYPDFMTLKIILLLMVCRKPRMSQLCYGWMKFRVESGSPTKTPKKHKGVCISLFLLWWKVGGGKVFRSSVLSLTKIEGWGFSDCLVAAIWHFDCRGPGSIPERGTMPPARWCGQN